MRPAIHPEFAASIPRDTSDTAKASILAALRAWIGQRPGLEFANYGDVSSYRAELRSITRDGAEAKALLRYVEMSSITGEQLANAFQRAFSGRLSWDGSKLDYCTGQYFPTEYRKAAAAVLASAIWSHWRAGLTGDSWGERLRKAAAREFGRGIGSRWFN